LLAAHDESANDLASAEQWDVKQSTETGTNDNIERNRWVIVNIRNLNRNALLNSLTYPSLTDTDMTLFESGDDRLIEPIGCPQQKFLRCLIENIDRTSIGSG
jgi:hypothetical protein